jgi:hypothetical protein
LIDAASGAHVWVERFGEALADLFNIQDESSLTCCGNFDRALIAAEAQRVLSAQRTGQSEIVLHCDFDKTPSGDRPIDNGRG